MSLLSKLLKALEPIDEDIVKKIVQAVHQAPDKLDLAALGADLAVPRASAALPREMSTSRKIPPSERRKHAKTIRTHAEKLFSALRSAHEVDAHFEIWRLILSRQQDEDLKAVSAVVCKCVSACHWATRTTGMHQFVRRRKLGCFGIVIVIVLLYQVSRMMTHAATRSLIAPPSLRTFCCRPGSRFSPRSEKSAATFGPTHRCWAAYGLASASFSDAGGGSVSQKAHPC
jgi:hypothetical protein